MLSMLKKKNTSNLSTKILIWMLFLKEDVFDHIISNSKWEMSAKKI